MWPTSVVDEAWPDLCLTTKGLKLLEGDVAGSE